MILLLAAGLAAQSMGFLVQANLVPTLGDQLWDTSFLLSESSIPGRILHTLVGYIDRPAGVQLLAYIVTLLVIGIPMRALSYVGRAAPGVSLSWFWRQFSSAHAPSGQNCTFVCRPSSIAN